MHLDLGSVGSALRRFADQVVRPEAVAAFERQHGQGVEHVGVGRGEILRALGVLHRLGPILVAM